jgi:dihydrofolate synthase/folylpolyglutamate synthase
MDSLSYQQALDFLYSFIDYGSERSDRYSPDVFELARIKRFLSRLGDPHLQYPAVHIAGTKGKGSVAALVATCLQLAGFKTGLYTSPHLVDFTERIQINREQIPGSTVGRIVGDLKPFTEQEPEITTYELTTALAFQYFAEQQIDIGVFEVGLGGRLDSTNVVEPVVSVITSLSYDHTHLLGDTLAEIAAEKAGIIKPGIPVISAPQKPEAERVLQQKAQEQGAPLEIIGRDWLFELLERRRSSQFVCIWPAGQDQAAAGVSLELGLLGDHQLENAAVAYAALQRAARNGFEVPGEALAQGFKQVDWPGRFQILQRQPTLVVDSAHNGYSALRLRQALEKNFPGQRIHLVFGASEDKDVRTMLKNLAPALSRATMTQAHHPRAAEAQQLVEVARDYIQAVDSHLPVRQAVAYALDQAEAEDVIVVTGSLFTVGEVLASSGGHREFSSVAYPGEVA